MSEQSNDSKDKILSVFREVDYDRSYTGKTTTIDRSVGIFSGAKETIDKQESTVYAPKIVLKATPIHRIERKVKFLQASHDTELSECEYVDVIHDTQAIVIADTKESPLMKREEVSDEYSYAYGLGHVQINGYKYVQDTDKVIHLVKEAAHRLGVYEQLETCVNKSLGLST